MLSQALHLSREMLAVLESGDCLDQLDELEQLELQRNEILTEYSEQDLSDEQIAADAELLHELYKLAGAVEEPLLSVKDKLRAELIGSRKNRKKIQAYH